ncbi:MAG: hypothetical protein ACPGQS_07635 [Bradymonadia bacterium]
MSKRRQSVRTGLLSGIVIGTLVSGWMWYVVDDREKENLLAQQSPIYKAQLSLQRYREALVEEDNMGQIFHLKQAIDALGAAHNENPDDLRRLLQQQNTILQLARVRSQLHQHDEARVLRKSVMERSRSLLEGGMLEESLRELTLAAFLDWAKTPSTPEDDIIEAGKNLASLLIEGFRIVSPLEQTRLATSDLQYIVLQKMSKSEELKDQLAFIDGALRSLMAGIESTTQPLIFAIQVQKFINESKRIADESKSHQLKSHFAALNLDWRRRRTLLEPLDLMAKVLLAEAILDHISISPDFNADALDEVNALTETVRSKSKSSKELRRLFFAHSKLGAYLSKRKKVKRARDAYTTAVEVARDFNATHPESLVTALSNLGFLTKRSNELDAAKALFDEAFTQAQKLNEKNSKTHVLWLKSYYRALTFGTLKTTKKNLNSFKLLARGHEQKLNDKERASLTKILKKLTSRGAL